MAVLTTFGGHAEYIYLAAVTLILNCLVAYQVLHRVARVKPGDKVLWVGSSGGVGTAFLQLGKLAGLKMYGLASPSKHSLLAERGAIPIDYHTQDFVAVLRQAEPAGLDFVFNGMGRKPSSAAWLCCGAAVGWCITAARRASHVSCF